MAQKIKLRQSVRDVLELISCKERQLEYQRDVPIANVPSELLCMWFDDLYHPRTVLFKNSFTLEEMKYLKAFNEFYDRSADVLPETLGELHKSEKWAAIESEPKKVLGQIKW